MSGRLVKDPSGTPATLDLAGAVTRVLMDRRYQFSRHTMTGTGGAVMTRAGGYGLQLVGTLSLVVTLADRTTLHGWMPELAAGTEMDVYLDAAGSADERVVLDGERVIERYTWLGPGLWSIDLPARQIKT